MVSLSEFLTVAKKEGFRVANMSTYRLAQHDTQL